jgi:hypothetical protein
LRRAAFRETRASSPSTSIRVADWDCGRILGAAATGCGSRSAAAPSSRPGSVSSTAATCRTHRFPRVSSCRSRSSTAGTRVSTTNVARSSSAERSRGRRTTSSGTARRPGARAFYLLDREALADESVAANVARAPAEARLLPAELPFDPPRGTVLAVHVTAAITHTIGGLRVDQRARALDGDGTPVDDLFAAGVDVGGSAKGSARSRSAPAITTAYAPMFRWSRPSDRRRATRITYRVRPDDHPCAPGRQRTVAAWPAYTREQGRSGMKQLGWALCALAFTGCAVSAPGSRLGSTSS